MRDYLFLDKYLDLLATDIYYQPSDEGHTDWCREFIEEFYPSDAMSVLDVGCGDGFSKQLFSNLVCWKGVTLTSKEIADARLKGINDILKADVSFLNMFEDGEFDLIFARHILEHSPMPLLTLMEWHRVSAKWLMCVLPAAEYWEVYGKNHYYVLPKHNWWVLFDRAGWAIEKERDFTTKDALFMKYYLPEKKDRLNVKWIGPTKTVEHRYLLRKK